MARFIPALCWMAFIFFLSTRQTAGVPGTSTQRLYILKSFHLIEYSILFLLLFFAFLKRLPAAIVAYLYALTDEYHQLFTPGRTGKFRDTVIDLLGIIIGVIILALISKSRLFSRKR